jgi:hypothetical protein
MESRIQTVDENSERNTMCVQALHSPPKEGFFPGEREGYNRIFSYDFIRKRVRGIMKLNK